MKKITLLFITCFMMFALVGCSTNNEKLDYDSVSTDSIKEIVNTDEVIGEEEDYYDYPKYKTMFDYDIDDGLITFINNKGTFISAVKVYAKEYDYQLNYIGEITYTSQYLDSHMMNHKDFSNGEMVYINTGLYYFVDDYDENVEYNKSQKFYEIEDFTYVKPYDDGSEFSREYIYEYIDDFDISYSIEKNPSRDDRYDIYVTCTNLSNDYEYTIRMYTFYKTYHDMGWDMHHDRWNEEDKRVIIKPGETVTEKMVTNMVLEYGFDTDVKTTLCVENRQ